jgi:hypothetical protein
VVRPPLPGSARPRIAHQRSRLARHAGRPMRKPGAPRLPAISRDVVPDVLCRQLAIVEPPAADGGKSRPVPPVPVAALTEHELSDGADIDHAVAISPAASR